MRKRRGASLILVRPSAAPDVIAVSQESVRWAGMGSDSLSEESPERRFRTLFISDVHLGARGSQADRLLDFLKSHAADTIYLVADLVDGSTLQSSWYWPPSPNDYGPAVAA